MIIHSVTYRLLVAYELEEEMGMSEAFDNAVEKYVESIGGEFDGCGSGFNQRDLDFYMPSDYDHIAVEAEINRLAKEFSITLK